MWKSLCFAIFWQILCNSLRFLTKVTPKIFQKQPGKETIVFFVDGRLGFKQRVLLCIEEIYCPICTCLFKRLGNLGLSSLTLAWIQTLQEPCELDVMAGHQLQYLDPSRKLSLLQLQKPV